MKWLAALQLHMLGVEAPAMFTTKTRRAQKKNEVVIVSRMFSRYNDGMDVPRRRFPLTLACQRSVSCCFLFCCSSVRA